MCASKNISVPKKKNEKYDLLCFHTFVHIFRLHETDQIAVQDATYRYLEGLVNR